MLLKRIVNIVFVLLVLAVLLSGLVNTVFFPDEISEYENRYANKLSVPEPENYLSGEFQNSMELALGDQVDLASTYKKLYNQLRSRMLYFFAHPLMAGEALDEQYFDMGSGSVFDGEYLVHRPYGEEDRTMLDEAIDDYNRLFAAHPEVDFYVYYVERALDIDLETGEKAGLCEYFFDGLSLPDGKKACFSVNSAEEYRKNFYKTDHHWKHEGSYRGYKEVLALLGCEETALEPTGCVELPYPFSGSSARGDRSCYWETFYAYTFDYPEMQVWVDSYEAHDYGNQEYYISGAAPLKAYGHFYGLDSGEVLFSTGRQDRENLLILGDSYDNAIVKLLASHYNITCAIDPRTYEGYLYKPFSFEQCLEDYDIDKVLILGNVDNFADETFRQGV